MITIKDVAKKAGVSVGTVSNVLNGLETVSAAVRGKVEKAINELGYQPSRIASSLSRKKTKSIGLIVPDVSSPFYSDLIKGISQKLESSGYQMYLCNSNNNLKREYEIIHSLRGMWVDGIILVPVYDDQRELDFLRGVDKPMVILNRDLGNIEKDTVLFNNFTGAYKATRYLLEKGHRDIICLNGPKSSKSAVDRYKGWKKAMAEYAAHKEDFVFWGGFSVSFGKKMMAEALAKFSCIDAVFATSDLLAMGAIKIINRQSLNIPEDISIMGFGDIYVCDYLNPALTTVARPFETTGSKAVEILVGRIENDKGKPVRIIIEGEIEQRDSVRPKALTSA
ncbi:MAG: LacI family DNA-binding transcriptional regulator [Actinomycetota bacterium]